MIDFNKRLISAFADKRIVPGYGNITSRVVMIGEAPGEKESEQLRPFVGKAGKNLDEFLALSGIDRNELYITNTVKFRPTAQGKKGLVNRKPTSAEIAEFRPWLMEELGIIRPEIIVTLGNVPFQALTCSRETVGAVHGRLMNYEGFKVYPMYHPASVIYNRSLTEVYRADVIALGELLKNNG